MQRAWELSQRPPDYIFGLSSKEDSLCIDAENSTHFSRFFNHHENGTLDVRVSPEEQYIHFYASCDIQSGDELTFDCALRHTETLNQARAEG